jgi:hypothetical protein
MCCVLTVLIFLGPRVAGIVWWLIQPARWVGTTPASAFSSWIWPVLGIIFLPWTTLMFVILAPGGIHGFFEWLFMVFAVIIDIGSYGGGGYGNRSLFPGTGYD